MNKFNYINRPSGEVLFMFFGISTESDKIRDALNRLVQRRRLNDFVLESTHLTLRQKPSLQIKVIYILFYYYTIDK